jgi:hypothetical protein
MKTILSIAYFIIGISGFCIFFIALTVKVITMYTEGFSIEDITFATLYAAGMLISSVMIKGK